MSRPIIGYIVDAATRLFTSRKIGGVDFDGTKDINLPGVNQPGNQDTTGNADTTTRLQNARTLTVGNSDKTFDGSVNVTWKLSEIGAAPSEHTHDDKVNVNGNQTIGGTKDFNGVLRATAGSNATSATSGSLRSSGGLGVALDIFAGGNVTAYSDVRKKKDIVAIDGALDIILKARGVYYTRKDTGVKEVGFIAQEMQKILPRVIGGTEESGLGISYGNITAVLAEAVKTIYNDHVTPVKERVSQLEDQNQKLIERLGRLEEMASNKLLNGE